MSRISRGRRMLFERLQSPEAGQCLAVRPSTRSSRRSSTASCRRRRAGGRDAPPALRALSIAGRAPNAPCPSCCARAVRSCADEHAPSALRARCRSQLRSGAGRAVRRPVRAGRGARGVLPLTMAAGLVLVVAGAVVYRATVGSTQVHRRRADRRSREMLRDERRARHARDRRRRANARWRRASAGTRTCRSIPSRPISNWSARGRASTARQDCAHHVPAPRASGVAVHAAANARAPKSSVDVLGHEAAIWSVGDRTFVLVAREPRAEVERMASFVHAALQLIGETAQSRSRIRCACESDVENGMTRADIGSYARWAIAAAGALALAWLVVRSRDAVEPGAPRRVTGGVDAGRGACPADAPSRPTSTSR